MTDGKYISPTLRKAYNVCLMDFDKLDNPFCAEGKVAMFAKRNSLFQKKINRMSQMDLILKINMSLVLR